MALNAISFLVITIVRENLANRGDSPHAIIVVLSPPVKLIFRFFKELFCS